LFTSLPSYRTPVERESVPLPLVTQEPMERVLTVAQELLFPVVAGFSLRGGPRRLKPATPKRANPGVMRRPDALEESSQQSQRVASLGSDGDNRRSIHSYADRHARRAMTDPLNQSQRIQVWIDRLQAGDEAARKELVNCACDQLTLLTRKMLRGFTRLKRWEETMDVAQNATLRLCRTLEQVRPKTVVEFYRLATLNIRRELLDLTKHYYRVDGPGARHHSQGGPAAADDSRPLLEPETDSDRPDRLATWAEFHAKVGTLPEEEREVFDLFWYQGLPQAEIAQLLNVTERTVKRRWRSARLLLHEALGGELPEL
jgi:RNA polymerase sigma factor (sigma-70 family)